MAFYCVEDDAGIRDIELYALQAAGYEAVGFEDADACWQALQKDPLPQLILLDVMLPGMEGTELLRRIRAVDRLCRIPVILATAKGAEYDRIRGLDLGADYYLTKPFSVLELLSCARAVLRRCGTQEPVLLSAGGLQMDLEARTVSADGRRLELTYKEFELLRLFLQHPGRAFTRENIMQQVWGSDDLGESRTVDMHIRTLRQKLGVYGEKIQTVRNIGYRLEESV